MAASATDPASTFWQNPDKQCPLIGFYMPYFHVPFGPFGFEQMYYLHCMPGGISWNAMNQCATGQRDDGVSAAIEAFYAIEDKFHAKVAVMHFELYQEFQDFLRKYLQPLYVSTPTVAVCETTVEEEKVLSCSGCANTGMTWLAQCAHQAIKEEGMDSTLLQTATEPGQIAEAYESVMAASPSSAKVAHLLRDLLVLTVCTNDGPWTNTSIQETMNELFDKPVDDNFMAKILLAYNTMHRAATSPQEFKRAVNIFAGTLSEKTSENLRAAYIKLYRKAPGFKSNAKFQRKNRPARKPKTQGKTSSDPTDLREDRQLCLDLADLQTSSAEDAGCVKPEAQKLVKRS